MCRLRTGHALLSEERMKSSRVRIGLGYVKNLTKRSAEALVAARASDGPFLAAEDLSPAGSVSYRQELARFAAD